MIKTLVCVASLMVAGISVSAQTGKITAIDFPYYDNYQFRLKGTTVYYDQYNFAEKTMDSETNYLVENHRQDKSGRYMHFVVKIYNEEKQDTMRVVSWLRLNKKGMSWGRHENGKDDVKTGTQAIRLPLIEGKSWKTLFGGEKAEIMLLRADTIIDTYLGKVHAFSTRYEQLLQTVENFEIRLTTEEYYHPVWGKIGAYELTYMVNTTTGKINRISENRELIAASNLPEALLAKVEFLKE